MGFLTIKVAKKMAIADDVAELEDVEQELESVEQELSVLLMRQSYLQARRSELQEALALGGDEDEAARRDDEPVHDWKAAFPWSSRVQELLNDQVL